MDTPAQSRLRILFVDDDEEDFILVQNMLAGRLYWPGELHPARYAVDWVANYKDALKAFQSDEHDVYLIDYRLGARDGLELLREAQSLGCKAPIILLTGHGSYEVDVEAMKAGASDYLSKNELTAAFLERTIRYALERKRTEEILRRAQDELEQRVQDRTRALAQANQQLASANRALLAEFGERKQVEEALRRAKSELEVRVAERTAQLEAERARLSTIIANAPAAIIVVDKECRIVFTNPVADHLYARHISFGENLSTQTVTNVYHPDGAPYDPRDLPLVRSALDGETQVNLEQVVIWPDGQRRYILVNSAPILDRKGNLNGAVGIFQDITQLKLSEEENLEKATRIEVQHHLMQSREMERLHVAQELHDGILQQLIGISFLVNNALAMFPPGDPDFDLQRKALANIQDTLRQEINDLRVFCSELRPPTLAPFGLEKAIRSYAETMQGRYTDLAVHLDLMSDAKRIPEPVRLALYRIYQELLNNVVRHAEARDAWVRFAFDESGATLEVEDNGFGFDVPEQWLEMARQGHLGLAGARERTEALRGIIKISSTPGKGTLIRVDVPLTKDEGQMTKAEG